MGSVTGVTSISHLFKFSYVFKFADPQLCADTQFSHCKIACVNSCQRSIFQFGVAFACFNRTIGKRLQLDADSTPATIQPSPAQGPSEKPQEYRTGTWYKTLARDNKTSFKLHDDNLCFVRNTTFPGKPRGPSHGIPGWILWFPGAPCTWDPLGPSHEPTRSPLVCNEG